MLAAVDADLSGAAAGDDDHAGDDGSFEELGFGDLPAASTDDLLADVQRLSRLVDDLLLLARSDEGVIAARLEEFDLGGDYR